MLILVCTACGCFQAATTELSSCDRNQRVAMLKRFTKNFKRFTTLNRKSFSDPLVQTHLSQLTSTSTRGSLLQAKHWAKYLAGIDQKWPLPASSPVSRGRDLTGTHVVKNLSVGAVKSHISMCSGSPFTRFLGPSNTLSAVVLGPM